MNNASGAGPQKKKKNLDVKHVKHKSKRSLSVRLRKAENLSLFTISVYFLYYLWISLYYSANFYLYL